MARKHQLREQRAGTVINITSKKQESDIIKALRQVEDLLNRKLDAQSRKSCVRTR